MIQSLMLATALFQEPRALVHSDLSIHRAFRLVDLDLDGRLDRVAYDAEGELEVSLNRGDRVFEAIRQDLPRVSVAALLAGDLNGDQRVDLYVVSTGANVALVGDGTGGFVDATAELGLADAGVGLSAEQIDIDADGVLDVVLHNQEGDVIFWGTGSAYERDPSSLPSATGVQTAVGQPASPGPKGAGSSTALTSGGEVTAPDPVGPGVEPTVTPGAPPSKPVPGVLIDETEGGGGNGGPTWEATEIPSPTTCALSLKDVTTSQCIKADTTPTMGRLLPIGPELFVSPTGLVGINTTSPLARFDVQGDFCARGTFVAGLAALENVGSAPLLLTAHTGTGLAATPDIREASSTLDNGADSSVLHLSRANATGDGAGGALYFRLPDNGGSQREYAGIGARVEQGLSAATPYAGALDLYTSDGGAARQRRVTVTGDGDVGIGNSTPAAKLDVTGDLRAVGNFQPGQAALETTGTSTMLLAAHSGTGVDAVADVRQASATVDNAASSPVIELSRANASADGAGGALYFQLPDNGGSQREYAGIGARVEQGLSAATPYAGALDLYTSEGGAARQRRVTVTGDGDVGIGGPDPDAPLADLHVVGDATAGSVIVAPDAAANATADVVIGEDRDAASSFRLRNAGASDQFQILSDTGTPTARIAVARDTGVVGIGTTDLSPTSPQGTGLLKIGGSVTQGINDTGIVKAAVHIRGFGATPGVTRSFNNLPGGGAITMTRTAPGTYIVNFGVNVSNRFFSATLGGESGATGIGNPGGINVAPRLLDPNSITVQTYDSSSPTPVSTDNVFYIYVY